MGLANVQVATRKWHPDIVAAVILLMIISLLGCGNPVAHIPEFSTAGQVPSPGIFGFGGSQYRLIPYDEVNIKFTYHSERDLKVPIPIQPDGNITLDDIGTIQAAGLTPADLGKSIAAKSSTRMRNPEVVVTVVKYAARKVFVGGEVRTPGPVEIREGMTPLQAIFDRGGFTPTAQIDSVVLIRDAGSKDPKIGRIDLQVALENASPERVVLLANDVIYVPMTGIGRVNQWVRQHLRDIVPAELLSLRPYGFC